MLINTKQQFTFDRVVRIAISLIVIFGIFYLVAYLRAVLVPFVIALIFAYFINPIVDLIQKKIKIRIISVIITLIIVFGIIIGIGWLIIPMIVHEINHLWILLSDVVNNNKADSISDQIPKNLWETIEDFLNRDDIKHFFQSEDFKSFAQIAAQKLLPGVWGFITGATSILIGIIGLIIIVLYIFFILKDYQKISNNWKELLPNKYKEPIIGFVKEFESIMNKYFRGQAFIAGSVGVLFTIGFVIIDLPMGILIGMFMGLLNMVPYLQTIGFIPIVLSCGLYALDNGTSFFGIFGLSVLVVAITQTIQETILIPKVMGKVTGFNPAMILLSLSIWGKLLGFFGLIIALPITFLILSYYRKFLASNTNSINES